GGACQGVLANDDIPIGVGVNQSHRGARGGNGAGAWAGIGAGLARGAIGVEIAGGRRGDTAPSRAIGIGGAWQSESHPTRAGGTSSPGEACGRAEPPSALQEYRY